MATSAGGTARTPKQTLLRRSLKGDGSTLHGSLNSPMQSLKSPMNSSFQGSAASSPSRGRFDRTPVPGSPTASSFLETESLANSKVWIRILGPEGQDQRARLVKNIDTTDLRKAVKIKTGVPVQELQLSVAGEPLMEGVAQPFLHHSADAELIVHWEKVDRLKSLMSYRNLPTLNARGKFDRTVLHFAVLDGEFDLCLKIINHKDREPTELLNVRDVFQDTPLMLASILGYVEIVEMLIDRQAFLDCQNLCGRTALQMAAEHGHKKVVKALLQEDAHLGMGPPRMGPMGAMNVTRSAPYLAELNERHQAKQKIRLYKISKKMPLFDL